MSANHNSHEPFIKEALKDMGFTGIVNHNHREMIRYWVFGTFPILNLTIELLE